MLELVGLQLARACERPINVSAYMTILNPLNTEWMVSICFLSCNNFTHLLVIDVKRDS